MDDFREWLSDNLRYFMLGGAILLIVAVLFFGVRACVGSKKGNSDKKNETTVQNDQGNDPSSPAKDGETDGKEEDANPMEKGNADVTALIESYYKAFGEKDIAALRTLVDDLAPSDESRITNAKDYIEGYKVGDVYTKKGLSEGTYVVYACYEMICRDIDTPVPMLSQLYLITDGDGRLKVDGGWEQDAEIMAYASKQQSDGDVSRLYADVKAANDAAQENDPVLAEFLAGLGEVKNPALSAAAENGTVLTVTSGCNVRAEADSEGDIIGGLDEGAEVEKKGTEGEWVQVEYEGQTGYIHSSLLKQAE